MVAPSGPLSVLTREGVFGVAHEVAQRFISVDFFIPRLNDAHLMCCQRIRACQLVKALELAPGNDDARDDRKRFSRKMDPAAVEYSQDEQKGRNKIYSH